VCISYGSSLICSPTLPFEGHIFIYLLMENSSIFCISCKKYSNIVYFQPSYFLFKIAALVLGCRTPIRVFIDFVFISSSSMYKYQVTTWTVLFFLTHSEAVWSGNVFLSAWVAWILSCGHSLSLQQPHLYCVFVSVWLTICFQFCVNTILLKRIPG
jgi:hypothetical protein